MKLCDNFVNNDLLFRPRGGGTKKKFKNCFTGGQTDLPTRIGQLRLFSPLSGDKKDPKNTKIYLETYLFWQKILGKYSGLFFKNFQQSFLDFGKKYDWFYKILTKFKQNTHTKKKQTNKQTNKQTKKKPPKTRILAWLRL